MPPRNRDAYLVSSVIVRKKLEAEDDIDNDATIGLMWRRKSAMLPLFSSLVSTLPGFWRAEDYIDNDEPTGIMRTALCTSIFFFGINSTGLLTNFMSDLDVQIPTAFDSFAEASADNSGAGSKDYAHIRIQQRNGRKSLTTVQGLKKEFSYNKILNDLKKEFCCNGTVVQDPEIGQVIQLQGDQQKNVCTFLVQFVSVIYIIANFLHFGFVEAGWNREERAHQNSWFLIALINFSCIVIILVLSVPEILSKLSSTELARV
ncbi:hypothetical protein K7X08_005455 [Anisodus acutangulus]|uniref:SUI1 domain-containing protein n=1 Tax=Anisodus acutangulus TaxID=402998 RepID=A0A9Q1LVE7_9SOLA|nr:hypothetical protein K7X08_005455 [Anisodus acutangulus]